MPSGSSRHDVRRQTEEVVAVRRAFRIGLAHAPTQRMSDLTLTALALEASHERLGWGLPARLSGIVRLDTRLRVCVA